MKMFLQQGYGMMGINREFAKKYEDIGFILSPRSLQANQKPSRLKEHADEIRQLGGKILFDPQFYQPRTNIAKILKFPYFDNLAYETSKFSGDQAKIFSSNVIDFQKNILQVSEYIIPGTYSNSLNEDWIQLQEDFTYGALASDNDGTFYQSISIGSDLVLNDNFEDFVGSLVLSKVSGYYITLKKPSSDYATTNETYLYNLLNAFLSLRLAGKKIILGYANPQDLLFTSVGIKVLASGNYQNVRSFDPDIFFENDEDNRKRRSKWYFDNNTLSEYKPEQLALLQKRGLLDNFLPTNEYTKEFLEASPISSFPWNETANFKNYLYCMYQNCNNIGASNNQFTYVENFFTEKEKNAKRLIDSGQRAGNRTFTLDAFEASLSALSAIKFERLEDLEELNGLS